MSKVTAARVYMIFAALLVLCAWRLSYTASQELARVQAEQAAQLDRVLGE